MLSAIPLRLRPVLSGPSLSTQSDLRAGRAPIVALENGRKTGAVSVAERMLGVLPMLFH